MWGLWPNPTRGGSSAPLSPGSSVGKHCCHLVDRSSYDLTMGKIKTMTNCVWGFYHVWKTCHKVREHLQLWEHGKGCDAVKSNTTKWGQGKQSPKAKEIDCSPMVWDLQVWRSLKKKGKNCFKMYYTFSPQSKTTI